MYIYVLAGPTLGIASEPNKSPYSGCGLRFNDEVYREELEIVNDILL